MTDDNQMMAIMREKNLADDAMLHDVKKVALFEHKIVLFDTYNKI